MVSGGGCVRVCACMSTKCLKPTLFLSWHLACSQALRGWRIFESSDTWCVCCLVYTSDSAYEEDSVDIGGARIVEMTSKPVCLREPPL